MNARISPVTKQPTPNRPSLPHREMSPLWHCWTCPTCTNGIFSIPASQLKIQIVMRLPRLTDAFAPGSTIPSHPVWIQAAISGAIGHESHRVHTEQFTSLPGAISGRESRTAMMKDAGISYATISQTTTVVTDSGLPVFDFWLSLFQIAFLGAENELAQADRFSWPAG